MLIRISLIIAIIAGLAVGVLNFVLIKDNVQTLKTNLKEQTEGRQKAETELASTTDQLNKTNAILTETLSTLASTTEQRDTAVAEVESLTKRGEQLTADLNKTREERDTAQNELAAYKATGRTPAEIVGMSQQYKNLEERLAGEQQEKSVLGRKLTQVQTELDRYKDPEKPVQLPASIIGKILVSDPKWNFVVVNVGGDQGVIEYGELLVNRNGRLVAKVRVSRVQKDRSVANIIPGWQLGEVLEGDQVIPAHPASS
jgi:hypothetical protein